MSFSATDMFAARTLLSSVAMAAPRVTAGAAPSLLLVRRAAAPAAAAPAAYAVLARHMGSAHDRRKRHIKHGTADGACGLAASRLTAPARAAQCKTSWRRAS